MVDYSFRTYEQCIPSVLLQKRLAQILIEKVRVLDVLAEISLVGITGTGAMLAKELARRLRLPYFLLPIELLVLPNEERTIFGAVSGIDDVIHLEPEICKRKGYSTEDVSNLVRVTKYNLVRKAQAESGPARWPDQTVIGKDSTVLLIDSAMVSKALIGTAIESLSRANVSRIVPVSCFLNKQALTGNSYALQQGIFLSQVTGIEALRQEVAQAEELSEQELERYFSTAVEAG